MQKRILFFSYLILSVAACKNEAEPDKAKPVEIPVVYVEQKDLVIDKTYVSNIQAIRNVELRSKVSGYLDAIYVDEGKSVKKGQLLFKISDQEFRADVAKAKAVLNTMKAEARIIELEYERVKLLVNKKIISQTELDLADSKLKAANARIDEAMSAVQNAEQKLSYTSVRAPFDGIVDRIPLKTGSLLSDGTLVTTVSDISSMYAYFDISENEYLAYKRKMSDSSDRRGAILILSDGREYEHKGKIETIVSEFEQTTGSISFRAVFPNPGQLLKHNGTGKVKLTANMEDALVIPQKAAFEIQDKNYVFVVDGSNTARMRSFVPGGRTDKYYIVRSGLSQGEAIVYEGIQNLKDGMKVIPKKGVQDSTHIVAR